MRKKSKTSGLNAAERRNLRQLVAQRDALLLVVAPKTRKRRKDMRASRDYRAKAVQ